VGHASTTIFWRRGGPRPLATVPFFYLGYFSAFLLRNSERLHPSQNKVFSYLIPALLVCLVSMSVHEVVRLVSCAEKGVSAVRLEAGRPRFPRRTLLRGETQPGEDPRDEDRLRKKTLVPSRRQE
jgi:hypothetical protein